jgi:DNA-binding transcriptional MerR regulator
MSKAMERRTAVEGSSEGLRGRMSYRYLLADGFPATAGLTGREKGLGLGAYDMASAAQAARELPEKSLFRIGEVSRLTATKTFVLRYWESEFPTLQPVKSPSGHRLYRREDIETVFEIKRLLYDEGFTIAGARRHLAEGNGRAGANGSAESSHDISQVMEAPSRPMPASKAHRKFLLDLHEELLAVLTLLERE